MSAAGRLPSLVLRHRPEMAGLELGPGGWVAVDDLLRGLAAAGHQLDEATLGRTVTESEKRRFTLSDDGRRIKAAQGHSVPVDPGLAPVEPPEVLFRRTAAASVAAILSEGLRPGRRRHVHLSADRAAAAQVGRRHGRPVVLSVASGAMRRAGGVFRRAYNGVRPTDRVEPEHLAVAEG